MSCCNVLSLVYHLFMTRNKVNNWIELNWIELIGPNNFEYRGVRNISLLIAFSWVKLYMPKLRGELFQLLFGVRGGRVVHGASDVSDSQACNQCLCGLWVRSQLAALDMLHRITGIFGVDHVPVVSSGHSGFLHHQIEQILISLIIGNSEGGFKPRDEWKQAAKMWNMN
jgi:hypothetical protein